MTTEKNEKVAFYLTFIKTLLLIIQLKAYILHEV